MGVKAVGASNLEAFMKLPYTTLLNLEGVGLTPTSARALSLVVRGYAACNLCSGQGTIANDIFATGTDPTGESLTFHQIFNFLDQDKTGTIDASELSAAFLFLGLSLSPAEIAALFARMDRDSSGEIDVQEFQSLFRCAPRRAHQPCACAPTGQARVQIKTSRCPIASEGCPFRAQEAQPGHGPRAVPPLRRQRAHGAAGMDGGGGRRAAPLQLDTCRQGGSAPQRL
jgi:hypothetical protein